MADGKITVEVNVTVNQEPAKAPQLPEGFFSQIPLTDTYLAALREEIKAAKFIPEETTEELPEMTLEEARGYLARAVLTQGVDFVYLLDVTNAYKRGPNGETACSYFPREDLPESDPRHGTACLIGVALRLAGRTVRRCMENRPPDAQDSRSVWRLSADAAKYFRAAQRHQDSGFSWGEAYKSAERFAESLLKERSYVDSKAARALI
jgi:hypothetical protein